MKTDRNQTAMKSISFFILIGYIILPFACFAHPDAWHIEEASSGVVDFFYSEYSDKQGIDNDESDSCFDDHTLFVFQPVDMLPALRLCGYSFIFSGHQVVIPIFVPPQNRS
jgi:hypothetical protein